MEGEIFNPEKLMTVELAIEREIEYRKKMELLNNPGLGDLKYFLPLQVDPPSIKVGLKRKEPSRNIQSLHTMEPAYTKRSPGFGCKICEITFTADSGWDCTTHSPQCGVVRLCFNCYKQGHTATDCTKEKVCSNCRKTGHSYLDCPKHNFCNLCNLSGHKEDNCPENRNVGGGMGGYRDILCRNCYKQGHTAAYCTNEKVCKNCRKTGHLASDCLNDLVCYTCNLSGHMARDCPRSNIMDERHSGVSGFHNIPWQNHQQVGYRSYDCFPLICYNCGGVGHPGFDCPSARLSDRFLQRYW